MKVTTYILILVGLVGCGKAGQQNAPAGAPQCRGVYYEHNAITKELMKYNETYNASVGSCLSQNIPVTNFEKTLDDRQRKNVKCKPQPGLPSMTLKADGEYYAPRNGNYYIDLDSATGEYRMLSIGTLLDGRPVIERKLGCYYLRTDLENEPVNPRNYGSMIMFDQENAAKSNIAAYADIYNYSDSGLGFVMTDPSPAFRGDWGDGTFCPYQSVPMGYCDLLKNGNNYFLPILSAGQEAYLANEAMLIRSTYTFLKVPKSEIDVLWASYEGRIGTSLDETAEVVDQAYNSEWEHRINFYTDMSDKTSDAWIAYMKGKRSVMPDLGSPSTTPVCFVGWQSVTTGAGNNATVLGQICYADGVYTFAPN